MDADFLLLHRMRHGGDRHRHSGVPGKLDKRQWLALAMILVALVLLNI